MHCAILYQVYSFVSRIAAPKTVIDRFLALPFLVLYPDSAQRLEIVAQLVLTYLRYCFVGCQG